MLYEVYLNNHAGKSLGIAKEDPVLVECSLEKSGAFEYGNGTCTVIYITPPGYPRQHFVLDTRYIKDITNNFEGFCESWIKEYFGENLERFRVC